MAEPKKAAAPAAAPAPAPEFFTVPDPHNVPVVFASSLVAAGQLNGVVNLTLAVARFSPNTQGTVDPDFVVASRLRLDIGCAAQVHAQLGRILSQAEAQARGIASAVVASSALPGASGKSN